MKLAVSVQAHDGTNFACLFDGVSVGGQINAHAAQVATVWPSVSGYWFGFIESTNVKWFIRPWQTALQGGWQTTTAASTISTAVR